MKHKYYITVLVEGGHSVSGQFEAETIQEAIEQALDQARIQYPGRQLVPSDVSLQEYGSVLRWLWLHRTAHLPAGVRGMMIPKPQPFTGVAA